MKLSIGILVEELNCLSNWQLRIIQELLNRLEIEVVLISKTDGETVPPVINSKIKFFNKSAPRFNLANILLQRQLWLEERLFFKRPHSTEIRDIISRLTNVRRLALNVLNHNGVQKFSIDGIKKINNVHLDVIVNLDNLKGLEEISKLATHGIWDFMFADSILDKYGPTGFWEVVNQHEGICFSLLNDTGNESKKHIIDTAFFNRGWSITETRNTVQEGAVSVFSKAINSLLDGNFQPIKLKVAISSETQNLNVLSVLRYALGFYVNTGLKIWEKIGNKIFAWRPERWSIFLGEGVFMDASLEDSKPLDMPNNEFWADPFLFKYKDSTYLFFENYSYLTKRGKISCGVVDGNDLIDVIDILDMDYHLSFPYIFEEDGEVFLMPEASENERLEIYRATEFPTTWELYSTAFEGERVADAFFHTDENKQKWLFLNKQMATTSPMNSELYIYKVDSIKLETIEPHAQNPVIIDARVARNGGSIFSYEGQLYRPSQRNTDAIYGRALNINKIEKLSLKEYCEKTERVVRPSFDKKLMAMHHVHQLDDQFVFDAAYRRK